MASSFAFQIPLILHVVIQLRPSSILDIGKGFGKYGMLLHEYLGIDNQRRIDPSRTMVQQSRILVDAVEADPQLMMPHLSHFYNVVHVGNVLRMYKDFPKYDLIMMIDVIEHLEKVPALEMIKFFLASGSSILIATPLEFFRQDLYQSEFESHVSHWQAKDFRGLGHVQKQHLENSAVYLLSPKAISIRGFGDSFIKKLRRLGRAVRSEL